MPIPATINDLSPTPGSNSPAGSESPALLDDYIRTHASFIAQLRDITSVISNNITSLSADTTLTAAQKGLVIVDASGANRTITLPVANAGLGVIDFIVRRSDNTTNTLVVTASGTDKIKFHTHLNSAGYSFLVLMGAGDYWHLRSDAAGSWIPISRYDNTPLGRTVLETTTAFNPGGYGGLNGTILTRAVWPWVWDHAQASGMLTTEALRTGNEGMWTSGDGSTTLRCPDGRARFQRPLDESLGLDTSRVAGTSQASSNLAHNHTYGSATFFTTAAGGGSTTLANWVAGSTGSSGGSEARPLNIAYPGRIKLI